MRAALTGLLLSLFAAMPAAVQAAEQPAGTAPPPGSTASPSPAAPSGPLLSAGQLAELVAPIALYPDELLSDVLMASTYPIEIVEADRWMDENKSLTGLALTSALDQQSWHASVKSLVATPTVLDMMNSQLGWTQQLGTAVLAQQADVMAAVQRLRAQAKAQHQLELTKQQSVSVQAQGSQEVIVIEPAVTGVLYVPFYNPVVVYGPWAYPEYLPYYWAPPPGYVLAAGIAFGVGFTIGDAAWHGYWGGYWGGFDWWHGNINIHQTVVINNNIHVNVTRWQHDVNDRPETLANTFRGDPQNFSDNAHQAFMNDFRASDEDGITKPADPTADRPADAAADKPAALYNAGSDADPLRDQGDGRDFGNLGGDAFGGWGGDRSDLGGGGFRGGDWGGGGARRYGRR